MMRALKIFYLFFTNISSHTKIFGKKNTQHMNKEREQREYSKYLRNHLFASFLFKSVIREFMIFKAELFIFRFIGKR